MYRLLRARQAVWRKLVSPSRHSCGVDKIVAATCKVLRHEHVSVGWLNPGKLVAWPAESMQDSSSEVQVLQEHLSSRLPTETSAGPSDGCG